MRMDHYGRMVDTLTDLWEELEAPHLVEDARDVRKALERAMTACVAAERLRRARQLAGETLSAMTAGDGRRNARQAA